MIRKKNPFSLLEILMALPLLALFISMGVSAYLNLMKLSHKEKTQTRKSKELHYFESRLQRMLLSTKVDQIQYEEDTLSFPYDNDVHENPKYSGEVLATLELKKRPLVLKVLQENDLLRQETYFKDLKSIELAFGYIDEDGLFFDSKLKENQPLVLLKVELAFPDNRKTTCLFEF